MNTNEVKMQGLKFIIKCNHDQMFHTVLCHPLAVLNVTCRSKQSSISLPSDNIWNDFVAFCFVPSTPLVQS